MIIASHAVSLRNTTIAELEPTPKDSDLVGGAILRVRDRRENTTRRVWLVRRDERDCESLPWSRPIHNR